jgi:hypothetical protein
MRIAETLAVVLLATFSSCIASKATIIEVEYTGTYTGGWSGNYDPTHPTFNPNGPFSGSIATTPFTLTFTFDTTLAQPGYFSNSSLSTPYGGFPVSIFPSVGTATFSSTWLSFGGNYMASDIANSGSTSQSISDEEYTKGAGLAITTRIGISASSPLIPQSILTPFTIDSGLSGNGNISFGYENTFWGGGFGNLQLTPVTLEVSISPIGDAVSAVPEPATWAMLLIGFAGLGFATLRKSNAQGGLVEYFKRNRKPLARIASRSTPRPVAPREGRT